MISLPRLPRLPFFAEYPDISRDNAAFLGNTRYYRVREVNKKNCFTKEESGVIEYFETLPEDKINWLKTITAFCNTSGGTLILGVRDSTLQITGINQERSALEQRIAETVHGNIEPAPFIDILFEYIEDKTIVYIIVSKGKQTPYYIKQKGVDNGCYVRYGSTDKLASIAQIEEFILKRKNEDFSQKPYEKNGKPVLAEDSKINLLLETVNKRSKTGKVIDTAKLFSWNLLVDEFDKTYATNGFMLLTDNPLEGAYVKVGLFDGMTKSTIIDDMEFYGSLIEQYDNTMRYLTDKLYKGFKITRYREKEYKIPEQALREVVSNAIMHRNYLEPHPIRIAIFDNRVEVFSPGTLYDGMQLSDVQKGISKLRNKNICEIFYHMGIIEKWGSGIYRANEALRNESLPPLAFDLDSIHGITVTIGFDKIRYDTQTYIFKEDSYLYDKKAFTRKEVERDLDYTQDQARYIIEKWTKQGLIRKKGAGSKTVYEVNE